MRGTQRLQCKSESAPQIIGAHQPQQACNEYIHIHCCQSTVTTGWKRGAHQLGQLSLTVRTPQPKDWGSLFNFRVWLGGGGTAISFAPRLHGICHASHNRMEEGAHLGHLSYRPALGLGISAPSLVSEFCLERYSSVLSSVTRLQGI